MGQVDLSNISVKKYITKALAFPKEHDMSPWSFIPAHQLSLYKYAVAYEKGEPVIPDHMYDMHIVMLQRKKEMFPDIWEACSIPCFKDGSWEYTGMFIKDYEE